MIRLGSESNFGVDAAARTAFDLKVLSETGKEPAGEQDSAGVSEPKLNHAEPKLKPS